VINAEIGIRVMEMSPKELIHAVLMHDNIGIVNLVRSNFESSKFQSCTFNPVNVLMLSPPAWKKLPYLLILANDNPKAKMDGSVEPHIQMNDGTHMQ
jgi:hypothetical protein